MTELLLGTNLTDKQRKFADTVYRSGEALVGILNDILDLSKIESGKEELRAVLERWLPPQAPIPT
jgi:signal transduction histidine kinase